MSFVRDKEFYACILGLLITLDQLLDDFGTLTLPIVVNILKVRASNELIRIESVGVHRNCLPIGTSGGWRFNDFNGGGLPYGGHRTAIEFYSITGGANCRTVDDLIGIASKDLICEDSPNSFGKTNKSSMFFVCF